VNWADWTIIGIITLSSLIGVWRGLIKEALSLVNWFVAFIVAISFKSQLALMMTEWLATPSLRELAAFALLFVATLIAGALLNGLLSSLVKATGLSGTDRMLGLIFGAARGAIIVLAIIILLPKLVPVKQDPWWLQAQLIGDFQAFEAWGVQTFQQFYNWIKSLF